MTQRGRRRTPTESPTAVRRVGLLIGVIVVVGLLGASLGLATNLQNPGTTPAPTTATASASADPASMEALVAYLRANHPAIYDADGLAGTADDLTTARLDLILIGGQSVDASPAAAILANLTALFLSLAATDLGAAGVAGADRICPLGTTNLATIAGAAELFGSDEPIIGQVTGTIETLWTGRLTNDGRTWTFDLPGSRQSTALAALKAMVEGEAITSSGC